MSVFGAKQRGYEAAVQADGNDGQRANSGRNLVEEHAGDYGRCWPMAALEGEGASEAATVHLLWNAMLACRVDCWARRTTPLHSCRQASVADSWAAMLPPKLSRPATPVVVGERREKAISSAA